MCVLGAYMKSIHEYASGEIVVNHTTDQGFCCPFFFFGGGGDGGCIHFPQSG